METIREEDHKEIANVLLDLYTLLLEYNSDIDRELEKRDMHIVFVMKKFDFNTNYTFVENITTAMNNLLVDLVMGVLSPWSKETFLSLRMSLNKIKHQWDTHIAYFESKHNKLIYDFSD